MRLTTRILAAASALILAGAPAFCDPGSDVGIDLKELEQSTPAPQASAGAPGVPVAPVAPMAPVVPLVPAVKPLVVLPPPNPMPLQWVPNGAPKDSELMDSQPSGASFTVSGIASQNDAYVAVVEYHGTNYIVSPGTMIPDQDDPAFQVRAITASRVEAFDPVARRLVRRSLPPLGGR